jgi:hypothetical protein
VTPASPLPDPAAFATLLSLGWLLPASGLPCVSLWCHGPQPRQWSHVDAPAWSLSCSAHSSAVRWGWGPQVCSMRSAGRDPILPAVSEAAPLVPSLQPVLMLLLLTEG